jgi:hypothetical protein
MFLVGLIAQWVAVYFTTQLDNIDPAEFSARVLLSLAVFTQIILVVKVVRLIGTMDFRKLAKFIWLATIDLVSLVIAMLIFVVH